MNSLRTILHILVYTSLLVFSACSTNNKDNKTVAPGDKSGDFMIGWASADLTPDKPVLIQGQYNARVSEGVMDPVTATVLALESGEGISSEKVLLISCDLALISDGTTDGADNNLRKTVRDKLSEAIPGLAPEQIILNATHTHAAPYCSTHKDAKEIYGVELDAMSPFECLQYISERLAEAGVEAWNSRAPGGVSYGLGHAVTGHNRLQVDMSGKSLMLDNTNRKDFSHIEGYEDHSVNLLYTYDKQKNLTGVVINIANPAQASAVSLLLSADFWHDTRVELRKRLGDDIFILPQCSAAGDQGPYVIVGSRAEQRMQRIMFGDSINAGNLSYYNGPLLGRRKQIAMYISDAVTSVLPYMKDYIEWNPVFDHHMEVVELSRRLIGIEDVNNAVKEADKWQKQYDQMLLEIKENPDIKQSPKWYREISVVYTLARRGQSVKERYELEKIQPKLPIEVHVIRLGEIVMAANPFELYLDYDTRIKARSPAVQTFSVQLAGSGTYLPTARSIAGRAYGAVSASTLVGPEGGQELVEKTLELINYVMED